MAVYKYRKFKISIDSESKKTQGLHIGDIVRRQYIDSSNIIYSLMCVLQIGSDTITSEENNKIVEKTQDWFIGALLEGDAPQSNELLDFVRVTNLWDANRLGAIYMTASDNNAPYIDMIDGIPVEQSLNYPTGINNVSWSNSFSQYTVIGKKYLTSTYTDSLDGNYRICKMTKNNSTLNSDVFVGLKQHIESHLSNPDRVLISYKIRSKRPMNNIIMSLGYEDETRIDGTVNISSTSEWSYQFHAITIDFSDRYKRVLAININDNLSEGDTVEIADFNIVLLSSIANFAGGLKMRLGKLNGVTDPVFGTLEDYGAYIQRLYATRQVNISGTLTAGDENGFGCTFYAGKIHKNVIINSVSCDFLTNAAILQEESPVGVGNLYQFDTEMVFNAQTNAWAKAHVGQKYTLSCWLKSDIECDVLFSQNHKSLKAVKISKLGSWNRYSVCIQIQEIDEVDTPLQIGILPSKGTICFTAPQLEQGVYVTQYQPTDDVLNYTDEYGAWFSRGGIGGTIQNPLIKLNADGSIASKDNSFIINNDGTGQLAGGRLKWTHNTVTLQGITIKWEDFDDTTKEELKPKSIKIIGESSFVYDNNKYSPELINLQIIETNFISSSSNRRWLYLNNNNDYVDFPNENGRILTILPDEHYWQDRSSLTVKCIVKTNHVECVDTITIQRIKNGEDAYSVVIYSTKGNTFKNGVGQTMLVTHVFKGGTDITSQMAAKDFDWIKTSSDPNSDRIFNAAHVGFGNQLIITSKDIWNMAQFDCKVRIT